jgi:glutathione S-transferase
MSEWRSRKASDFVAGARRAFRVLEDSGFRLERAEQLPLRRFPHERHPVAQRDALLSESAVIIEYVSPVTRVTISHDPRCEISVALARLGDPAGAIALDLDHIVWATGADVASRASGVYDAERTAPETVLERLAGVLDEIGRPWLLGDAEAFTRARAAATLPRH